MSFLHDWPWISPWIKSKANELDINIHVIALQLSHYCDVISNQLWHHQQNEDRVSETWGRCVKILVFIVIYEFIMSYRNKIMYVLSWKTVSALTRVLLLCLFTSLLRNLGNKHKNNPLMSAETVCHSSTYIVLYTLYTVIWHGLSCLILDPVLVLSCLWGAIHPLGCPG